MRFILDRIRHWLDLPHDPRMRLTLKDMARHMPKSRVMNPYAALPTIDKSKGDKAK